MRSVFLIWPDLSIGTYAIYLIRVIYIQRTLIQLLPLEGRQTTNRKRTHTTRYKISPKISSQTAFIHLITRDHCTESKFNQSRDERRGLVKRPHTDYTISLIGEIATEVIQLALLS